MKVWIVTSGEHGEGSDVVSVWSERDLAEKAALVIEPIGGGDWKEEWRDEEKTTWSCGCLSLEVSAFEVDKPIDARRISSAR